MSEKNVARLQAAVEAFNQRDGAKFDQLLAPEAEIVPVRAALEGTTYRGRDAASQYVAAVEESWEALRWEVDEWSGRLATGCSPSAIFGARVEEPARALTPAAAG